MKKKLLILVIWLCGYAAFAQQTSGDASAIAPFNREIEANFLSSYYQQDGDNAAVTGGVGTEQLTNFANVFMVNVPIDSINAVGFYGGADYYTSASTDNIDNNVSSASSMDLRGFGTVSYTRLNLKRGETYSVKVGFSGEYDVISFSGGLTYTKAWNNSNSVLSIGAQAFFDQWSLIYPRELRGRVSLPTSSRRSYNGSIVFSQVLSKRSQMSLSAEVIYMQGLLSTPFHRVFFADQNTPDIERLPSSRLKVPLSVRFNCYPTDRVVLRSYYRYYRDDFGIQANTMELEVPIKLSEAFTIAPFFRYHTQAASDYFAPYQEHRTTESFYTSDFDLADLNSQKVGMSLKYYPTFGIARSKPFFRSNRLFMFESIELRGAYYRRDTGLNAFIGSVNIGFSIK